MKKIFLFLSFLIILSIACSTSVTVTPPNSLDPLPTNTFVQASTESVQIPASATPIPVTATPMPVLTSTAIPQPLGVEVSVGHLSVLLPPGLASGVQSVQFTRKEGQDLPYWELTPGHTQFKLDGYLLQGRSQEPQIYIYPAQDYAMMVPGAFESIHRLDNILYGPGGSISNDQLPMVPFFNSKQAFASNIQILSFKNGGGVRFLTEYAQYAVSANNHELFYHFEGMTRDGVYYIIAVLPVSVPVLAETSDGGAPLPSGGIPYSYFADPNTDMQGYYKAVKALLSATSPEDFSPKITQLDMLIQSMRINQ